MKNLSVKIITVFVALLLTNCTKDDMQISDNDQSTLKKIIEISTLYLASQDSNASSNFKANIDPKVSKIDIDAVIKDYNDNGDYDGAICIGIQASMLASNGIMPNNSGGDVTNNQNAYDFVGKLHVEVLYHGLTDQKDFIFPNGIFNYYNLVQYSSNYLSNQQSNYCSLDQFNSFYNDVINDLENANNKLSIMISHMEDENKITALESQILQIYFKSSENSNSLGAFVQYSIQIENLITTSNFSEETKKLLLISMATARHDINFWNPFQS